LFGPGDLMWELQGQRLLAATSGGAFLLQVMHPAIGAVVDAESVYRTDTWGRAERSWASVQTWIYGGPEALEESRRLRQMHKSLGATDAQGRTFHALEPGPWAWVPLTAYQSTVEYCRRFADPLSAADEHRLYDEVLKLCRILQVPERMLPPTRADYWTYFDDMVDNVLVDHPVAHELIASPPNSPAPPTLPSLLHPAWLPARRLLSRFNRTITVGLLPPAARDKLGLRWTRADGLQLRALGRALAAMNERIPEKSRYLPIAYHAREAARQRAALTEALATRAM